VASGIDGTPTEEVLLELELDVRGCSGDDFKHTDGLSNHVGANAIAGEDDHAE